MKQISSLLDQLLNTSHTPFTKKLIQSSLMINNPSILMSDILYLIECFEGFGPECNGVYLTGTEYLQQFFKTISQKQLQGYVAVKIALTLHLVLYEFQIGEIVADELIKDGNQLHIVQNQAHSQFVQNYMMYLMKLAQNLKLFYACKIGQYPIFESDSTYTQQTESTRENQLQQFNFLKKQQNFRETNIQYRNYQQKKLEIHLSQQTGFITTDQKILYLFKLHNLLNQCVQIMNLSIGVLSSIDKQDYKNIYIEISCVLWNDTMVMYKFATQELCKLLDSFRYLTLQQLLSLQQIYWATLSVTKSIRWIHTNRKYFDTQNIVKQPLWFEENPKLSKELQNVIIDNKILIPETNRNKIQTPKAPISQKSPPSISQPFSSRVGSNSKQPYFVAHKKLQSISQQQMSQEKKQAKQVFGNIFSDEQLQISPREVQNSKK